MTMTKRAASILLLTVSLAMSACGGDDATGQGLDVQWDEASQRVQILVNRPLNDGETLHARVRHGVIGELECAVDYGGIERVDDSPLPATTGARFEGPTMTIEDFDTPYASSDWISAEPTADMLAAIADGRVIIDVCLMKGAELVEQGEFDARRALDRRGENGKFDGPEARIVSTVAYAEECIAEMGEIPFFPEVAEGDYGTYNCLDSVPIPTTVTGADGSVEFPLSEVSKCDNPQYIYSSCEPNATADNNGPRVARRTNDQGTSWVLLCRKAKGELGQYNDIAMIGSNPYTGRTCFFQNALYNLTDGEHVPHPADKIDSEASPQQSASLWEGIQGGVVGPGGTSNIECGLCHSTDAFIHSPWIDGALDDNGEPVVPRAGVHPDFALGYNDQPYYIVNSDGQGWIPAKQLVNEEASACTRCHRIGQDVWSGPNRYNGGSAWINRIAGEDSQWQGITTDAYNTFDHHFWMPPSLEGLDENNFWDSDYGKAIRFIQMCGNDPMNAACNWTDVPRDPIDSEGDLPEIDLEGPELAKAALVVLGADIMDASCPGGECATRRCAECHAVSRNGLRRWLDFTDHAWETCGVRPVEVDADQQLVDYVNTVSEDTLRAELRDDYAQNIIDARPFPDGAAGVAALDAVSGVGPATMARLRELAIGDPEQLAQSQALDTVNCFRAEPTDENSVFTPEHLGVLATGVQYGYFRGLFRAAYGDNWPVQYGRFKNRVSMPKGQHPALTQREYAIVLKWFENRLNDLDAVFPEAPPPDTCTESFDRTALDAHISNMQFEGWATANEDSGIRMYGCPTVGGDARGCLTSATDNTSTWGNGIGTIRMLRDLGFRTSYWMRSSADGRFVGNGGSSGDGGRSTITDLQNMRNIGVQASYDPGFFPDNSGFIFQGASGGAGICTLSVLESDASIDFTEPGCITARGINLYQHVARGLSGGDYFVINSQFTSDPGSGTEDPRASFNASSTIKITPMIFDGTNYQPQEAVIVDSPYEGDSVLSPSTQLVSSRLAGPNGHSLGYVLRRVTTTAGSTGYRVTLSDPIATACFPGGKPSFSYDERFMVTHHYEESGDGTSNLHLLDLATGQVRQITNMPAGMKALFPHFRSDGWIYFLVWGPDGERYVTASDAALEIAAMP